MPNKSNGFFSRKKKTKRETSAYNDHYLSPAFQHAVNQIKKQLTRDGIEVKPSIQVHIEILALLKLQRISNPCIIELAKAAPDKYVDLLVNQYRGYLENLEVY